MKIYTKTGDKGETSLFGGKRIAKDDPQIEAAGNVDELTSFIGLLIAKVKTKNDQTFLLEIQKDLYTIMAFLASYNSPIESFPERITLFEQKIDKIQSQLPELTSFILPSGTEISSICHIVRTVCRRTERSIVGLSKTNRLDRKKIALVLQYLNRLSDLFFALARWYNESKEIKISLIRKK
ncbi:MAG: cob(I)yrinic acid a,c-diamide adenosyltransferase [Patescibacteria group bacterium]